VKTEEVAGEPAPAAAGSDAPPSAADTRRSRRREGVAVFAAGYLVHAALALVMKVPIVMYDEYGYFATARHLAGEGQATHLRYHPGYAFVLIPAFLVTSTSDGAYHVALFGINALLGALTTLIVWRLVLVLAPAGISRRARLLSTAAVALSPSWLLYTNLTWSENLLIPIAAGLVLMTGRLARGSSAVFALGYGTLAGFAYLAHPRGLGLTGAAVLVGLLVLPRAGRLLRGGLLLSSAAAVTVAARPITRDVTDSAGWKSESFLKGFGLGDVPHLLAAMGGHLFYLSAATYGLAPLGVYAFVCLLRREGFRTERGAIALCALVAAGAMLFVSGMFWHDPFRSDQPIYGRYDEATLVPILTAGVLLLQSAAPNRTRIGVMLVPIALLGFIPQLVWSETLRSTPPVNYNILGVAPIVALGTGVHPLVIALAHGLVAVLLIVLARRRPGALLPVLCAGMVIVGLGLEIGLFRHGSRDRAREQRVGAVLERLTPLVPPAQRCVAFDRNTVDVFAASSYRYFVDGWRFAQPGEATCPDFFLTRQPVPLIQGRVPGATIVASERLGSTNRLWIRRGPLQDALVKAGVVEGR
jgi:hypothetical protein